MLNSTRVAEHLLPLFEYAASVIPPDYHPYTSVKYQATAGMRLLPDSEQEAVYDALYQGLMESDTFVFRGMKRGDIATLSGELEGFYGAVAANYLQGIVDAELKLSTDSEHSQFGPVGALDMGGSSTQIVFLPDTTQRQHNNMQDREQSCRNDDMTSCEECQWADANQSQQLNGDHFFSTSHLSYGVDQFRERLWTTLVEARVQTAAEDTESCSSKIVENPCANKGFRTEWMGFTLVGTGDTDECIRLTQRLIPHPEIPLDERHQIRSQVGGVQHPPVRGKFLAMSLFFFSLDSLRVFSEPYQEAHRALNRSWPNPSIQELHDALYGLCSREWEGDMALLHDAHEFTRQEVLGHRCIEAVYMVTLLKDGYGFHPASRDITFTFLVDGSEVEWTLGMALSIYAEETAVDNRTDRRGDKINITHQDAAGENETMRFHIRAHPLFVADSL
jgi:Golgi nucleoside diphosphatase